MKQSEMCKRLYEIAEMLDRDYKVEKKKTTRAIYLKVSKLYTEIKYNQQVVK